MRLILQSVCAGDIGRCMFLFVALVLVVDERSI